MKSLVIAAVFALGAGLMSSSAASAAPAGGLKLESSGHSLVEQVARCKRVCRGWGHKRRCAMICRDRGRHHRH